MSTLTVLIPPRDAADGAEDGAVPGALEAVTPGGFRYVLTDRRGAMLQAGTAPLALLPKAQLTCLVLAARDVLLVDALVPPLHGQRLQQALPNIIEDWLLPDSAPVHLAVGPLPGTVGGARKFGLRRPRGATASKAATLRTLAAVDRSWLRDLLARFEAAGHKALRAVPMTGCLPLSPEIDRVAPLGDDADAAADLAGVDQASATVAVLIGTASAVAASTLPAEGVVAPASDMVELTLRRMPVADAERLDVTDAAPDAALPLPTGVAAAAAIDTSASAHRLCGEGLRIAATDVVQVLDIVAPQHVLYYLAGATDGPSMSPAARGVFSTALPFTMEALALGAQRCPIDLCQFEFAPKGLRLSGDTWRQVRWPVILLAASVLVTVVGLNVRWMQLVHQRNAIQAAMTERLLSSFPTTTVVLDPVVQMSRSLDALRVAAGELSPNDFLTLTNGLSSSMGGISPNGVAAITYDRGTLQVVFRSDASVDSGLRERLARQGLDATVESRPDGQHWTIRSRR